MESQVHDRPSNTRDAVDTLGLLAGHNPLSANLVTEDLLGELSGLVVRGLRAGQRSGEVEALRSWTSSGEASDDGRAFGHGKATWADGKATLSVELPDVVRWNMVILYPRRAARHALGKPSFHVRFDADLRSRQQPHLLFAIPTGDWHFLESHGISGLEGTWPFGLEASVHLTLTGGSIELTAGSLIRTMSGLRTFAADPGLQTLVIEPDDQESPLDLRRKGGDVSVTVLEYGVPRSIAGRAGDLARVVRDAITDLAVIIERRDPRILEIERLRWLRDALPLPDVVWIPVPLTSPR